MSKVLKNGRIRFFSKEICFDEIEINRPNEVISKETIIFNNSCQIYKPIQRHEINKLKREFSLESADSSKDSFQLGFSNSPKKLLFICGDEIKRDNLIKYLKLSVSLKTTEEHISLSLEDYIQIFSSEMLNLSFEFKNSVDYDFLDDDLILNIINRKKLIERIGLSFDESVEPSGRSLSNLQSDMNNGKISDLKMVEEINLSDQIETEEIDESYQFKETIKEFELNHSKENKNENSINTFEEEILKESKILSIYSETFEINNQINEVEDFEENSDLKKTLNEPVFAESKRKEINPSFKSELTSEIMDDQSPKNQDIFNYELDLESRSSKKKNEDSLMNAYLMIDNKQKVEEEGEEIEEEANEVIIISLSLNLTINLN